MLKPVSVVFLSLFTFMASLAQIRIENVKMDSFYIPMSMGYTRSGDKGMGGSRLHNDVYRVLRHNGMGYHTGYHYENGKKIEGYRVYDKYVFSFDLSRRQAIGDLFKYERWNDTGKLILRMRVGTDTSSSGSKWEFADLCKGVYNGKYLYYGPRGNIIEEKNYVKDVLQGTAREWYDSDTLRGLKNYKDGQLNGEYRVWSTEGKIAEISNYKDGWLDGESRRFYTEYYLDNGVLQELAYFQKGQRTGSCTTYYKGGIIESIENYRTDGSGELLDRIEWFPGGRVYERLIQYPKYSFRQWNWLGYMRELTVQDSISLRWNSDNVLIYSKTFDKKTGYWVEKSYHNNGKIESIQKHKQYDYSPFGPKSLYDENGKKLPETEEEAGYAEKTIGRDDWGPPVMLDVDRDRLPKIQMPYSEEELELLNRTLNDSLEGVKIKKKDKGRHRFTLEITFDDNGKNPKVKASFPNHVFVSEELKLYLLKMLENATWKPFSVGNNNSSYLMMTGYIILE